MADQDYYLFDGEVARSLPSCKAEVAIVRGLMTMRTVSITFETREQAEAFMHGQIEPKKVTINA